MQAIIAPSASQSARPGRAFAACAPCRGASSRARPRARGPSAASEGWPAPRCPAGERRGGGGDRADLAATGREGAGSAARLQDLHDLGVLHRLAHALLLLGDRLRRRRLLDGRRGRGRRGRAQLGEVLAHEAHELHQELPARDQAGGQTADRAGARKGSVEIAHRASRARRRTSPSPSSGPAAAPPSRPRTWGR